MQNFELHKTNELKKDRTIEEILFGSYESNWDVQDQKKTEKEVWFIVDWQIPS